MKLELNASPEEVMRAVEAMQDYARALGLPEKIIYALALALEECASNIVNHALQRDPQKHFWASFERANDSFIIELRDRGPGFDITAAPERPPQADADDLLGGWGIQLVRRNMDNISYRRESGENILRLAKRLPTVGK